MRIARAEALLCQRWGDEALNVLRLTSLRYVTYATYRVSNLRVSLPGPPDHLAQLAPAAAIGPDATWRMGPRPGSWACRSLCASRSLKPSAALLLKLLWPNDFGHLVLFIVGCVLRSSVHMSELLAAADWRTCSQRASNQKISQTSP